MKRRSTVFVGVLAVLGPGIVGAALFLHLGPACGCISFESEMDFRLGFPLDNSPEKSIQIVLAAVPKGSSVAAVRRFITRDIEPLDPDDLAKLQSGDADRTTIDQRRLNARLQYDRFCQESRQQVTCRFQTQRYLFGTNGFDLIVSLTPDQRVNAVEVPVHKWWQ